MPVDNAELFQGHLEQAWDAVRRGEAGEYAACRLALALTLGLPVPDSTIERHLTPEHPPAEPSLNWFLCTGLHLLESGRAEELEGLIRRLRAAIDTSGGSGVSAGQRQAVVRELRGYRAWQDGNLERATRLWSRSNESAIAGALWRGDLYRNLGQLERAEGWYLAAWGHPVAHERLGQLYEEMGKSEKAAAAYRRFIEAWEDADPELQPRVESARERLKELTASEAGTDE